MKKICLTICLALQILSLSGCSSFDYHEKKAPCGPSASLSKNPCVHIPINLANVSLAKTEKPS